MNGRMKLEERGVYLQGEEENLLQIFFVKNLPTTILTVEVQNLQILFAKNFQRLVL